MNFDNFEEHNLDFGYMSEASFQETLLVDYYTYIYQLQLHIKYTVSVASASDVLDTILTVREGNFIPVSGFLLIFI